MYDNQTEADTTLLQPNDVSNACIKATALLAGWFWTWSTVQKSSGKASRPAYDLVS